MSGFLLLAGASLSACSPETAGSVDTNDPFDSKAKKTEDKFGEGFGNAFRANPNSEPVEVSEADVVPVNPTAEPVPIN